MEQQNTKIKFYEVRTFGMKLNVSFDFLKQNFKPLLKYITYLILPVCIIQMFFSMRMISGTMGLMQVIFGSVNSMDAMSLFSSFDWTSYTLAIICSFIGSAFVVAVVYSLMQIYNESENGLQQLTFAELKPYLLKNLGKYLVSCILTMIIIFAVVFVCVMLTSLSALTAFLSFPLMVVILIPLSMFIPIYMFENIGIGGGLSKAFKMGFATWGGIFLVSVIMLLIGYILQIILSMPYSAMMGIQAIFALSDTVETTPAGFNAIGYLLGVISLYGTYLASVFWIIGMAYQYSHAAEKMNSVSVVDDIENFDKF